MPYSLETSIPSTHKPICFFNQGCFLHTFNRVVKNFCTDMDAAVPV